eukprot:c28187_g1_i1 orf=307-3981(+)
MGRDVLNRHIIYTNKDYTGCMGGFLHLFDFNQALAGRKMLTDRKFGNDLDEIRNSPDAPSGITETPKIGAAKTSQDLFEGHTKYVQNKLNGTPVNSLMAKELSNEVELKNQAPNVVARLMGLDELPTDLKTVQKSKKMTAVNKVPPKAKLEKLWNEKNVQSPLKLYPKNLRNLTAAYLQGSGDSKFHQQYGTDSEDEKAIGWVPPFVNQPKEKQLWDFKGEDKAQCRQKSRECPRSDRSEGVDMKVDAKEMLVCEKLKDSKLTLRHEKVSGTKYTESQEKFQESIEVQDAVDFLQSNKDIFLKFLQEPSSLLGRQLHGHQPNLKPSVQPLQTLKHKRVQRAFDSNVAGKNGSRGEVPGWEFVESRRRYKRDLNSQMRCATDLGSDNDILQGSPVLSLYKNASPLLSQDQEMQFSPVYGDNRMHNMGSQVPTRIVVLKPSSGKVRNWKSSSSPTNFREASMVARDNDWDALLELRRRLMKEGREYVKEGGRQMRPNCYDHFQKGPQDPREIAREIARQVRESVTRDLLIDSGRSRRVQSNVNAMAAGRRNNFAGDMSGSSDGESCTLSGKHFLDLQNRVESSPLISPRKTKSFEAQNIVKSKERKKRFQEKLKILSAEQSEGKQYQLQNTYLRKSCPHDYGQQASPSSKISHVSKASGKGTAGDHISKRHLRAVKDILKSDGLPKSDIFGLAGFQSGGGSTDCSPRTLLRSRSVPIVSANVDGGHAEPQIKRADEGINHSSELAMDEVVGTSAVESNRMRDGVDVSSILSKKVSSLKGNLTLSRKRAASSNSVGQAFLQCYGCAVPENGKDLPALGKLVHAESSDLASLSPCMYVSDENDVNLEISSVHGGQPLQDMGGIGHICIKDSELSERQTVLENAIASRKTEELPTNIVVHSSESLFASSSISFSLPNKTEMRTLKASYGKLDQPSPVSVLDLPFTEEVSSPVNFKELHSDLQELRSRLFLLKDVDSEIPGPDLEMRQNKSVLIADERTQVAVDNCSLTVSESEMMADTYFPLSMCEFSSSENIAVDTGARLDGKELQIAYVKDILIASGFVNGSAFIFARWYAPSQPLNPHLFQRMESSYCRQNVTMNIGEPVKTGKIGGLHELPGPFSRQLLFDCVNEILFEILGPYLNQHPWVKPSKVAGHSMPSGNKLVDLVLTEVGQLLDSYSELQDTSEFLVAKDLAKSHLWMDLTDGIETVGLELEKTIVNDLIEEAIISVVL